MHVLDIFWGTGLALDSHVKVAAFHPSIDWLIKKD